MTIFLCYNNKKCYSEGSEARNLFYSGGLGFIDTNLYYKGLCLFGLCISVAVSGDSVQIKS